MGKWQCEVRQGARGMVVRREQGAVGNVSRGEWGKLDNSSQPGVFEKRGGKENVEKEDVLVVVAALGEHLFTPPCGSQSTVMGVDSAVTHRKGLH